MSGISSASPSASGSFFSSVAPCAEALVPVELDPPEGHARGLGAAVVLVAVVVLCPPPELCPSLVPLGPAAAVDATVLLDPLDVEPSFFPWVELFDYKSIFVEIFILLPYLTINDKTSYK